jgi:hypothetical protein
MIDMFCVRDPGHVSVQVCTSSLKNSNIRGLYTGSTRDISLFGRSIEKSFAQRQPMGGNISVADSLDVAYALVLRHEIQHMNQHILSGETFGGSMFSGRYRGRPGEVDARASVDSSYSQIMVMLGYSAPTEKKIPPQMPILMSIFESMISSADVDGENFSFVTDDLIDELKMNGLNSPSNLVWLRESLASAGVQID